MALTLQKRLQKLSNKKSHRKLKTRSVLANFFGPTLLVIIVVFIIVMVELAHVRSYTVIPWSSAFTLFSISGIVCALLVFFWKPKHFAFAFVLGGWFTYAIVLWANQYFAHDRPFMISRPLLKKSYGGRSGPRAEIRFEGVAHTVYADREILEHNDQVDLTIVRGYFYYPCIKIIRFAKEH